MRKIECYAGSLAPIKTHIRAAQTRAVLSADAQLIQLYWQVGALLHAQQAFKGWVTRVIPRLAHDLRNELPRQKSFSERNLKRMLAYHWQYADSPEFVPQPVAQIDVEEAGDPAARLGEATRETSVTGGRAAERAAQHRGNRGGAGGRKQGQDKQ